jgi:hypothetical protein
MLSLAQGQALPLLCQGHAQGLPTTLEEARLEQRRVKGSVCRILLAHQLVNTGRLDREHGAQLMAHKGGRVKLK